MLESFLSSISNYYYSMVRELAKTRTAKKQALSFYKELACGVSIKLVKQQ